MMGVTVELSPLFFCNCSPFGFVCLSCGLKLRANNLLNEREKERKEKRISFMEVILAGNLSIGRCKLNAMFLMNTLAVT